jgi:hypothetical protein
MPSVTKCLWCGGFSSRVSEKCQHCNRVEWTSEPVVREGIALKLSRWTGAISGLVLMGLTGGIVWGITGLPSIGLVMFFAGAAIWFGICQAFRNNSPSTMRVLRWLFPYDSWTLPQDQ